MRNHSRVSLGAFIVIATLSLVQPIAFAGELSIDLKKLENAKVFSYGEVVNQATKNELYAAYKRVLTNWTKLEAGELQGLMRHGTAAGKLFAAALTWETNCYRGHPEGMKSGFEQLKGDNSKVMYRSGCLVSEHTVAEVAGAFLKSGEFQDFRLSSWCKKPVSGN